LTFVDGFFTLLTLKKLIKLQMILTNSLLDARSDCTDSYNGPKVYVRLGQILFVNALLFLDL